MALLQVPMSNAKNKINTVLLMDQPRLSNNAGVHGEEGLVGAAKFVDMYYHRQKKTPPPYNHLDIRALRLPTLARNQAGDWLIPSQGRQPQSTDVQVVAGGGGVFSVYDGTQPL